MQNTCKNTVKNNEHSLKSKLQIEIIFYHFSKWKTIGGLTGLYPGPTVAAFTKVVVPFLYIPYPGTQMHQITHISLVMLSTKKQLSQMSGILITANSTHYMAFSICLRLHLHGCAQRHGVLVGQPLPLV